MTEWMQIAKKNRSAAFKTLAKTQAAKTARREASNGFKALVNMMGPVQLRRVVLSRNNMTNAEQAYVAAALRRKQRAST